ncbi:RHS domain-containing protein [Kosakonia sacchari]|nr:RHS domain-containing protein [Kosakonia sacchari]
MSKSEWFVLPGCLQLHEQHDGGHCSTCLYDPNEAWSPLGRIDHLQNDSSGEIFWFSTDLNGAPLEATDANGAVRWSGHYGSFGEVRHQTEGFIRQVQNQALSHQPLRYSGQYADSETGLRNNLFRYYDPQVGRFIVQDPIGLNGRWNLYQYAPNPLIWIDPFGRAVDTIAKLGEIGYRGVKQTPEGSLDYSISSTLHNKKLNINQLVKTQCTGDYERDFQAANEVAGLNQKKAPEATFGITWMIMIPRQTQEQCNL